jgi:hypothetical protein
MVQCFKHTDNFTFTQLERVLLFYQLLHNFILNSASYSQSEIIFRPSPPPPPKIISVCFSWDLCGLLSKHFVVILQFFNSYLQAVTIAMGRIWPSFPIYLAHITACSTCSCICYCTPRVVLMLVSYTCICNSCLLLVLHGETVFLRS